MALKFEKTTYAEILKGLEETQAWLNYCGIKTKNTRLSEILDLVGIINEHFNKNTIDQLISDYKKDVIFYALTDADTFVNLYRSFKNQKSHTLKRSLLDAMIKGPLLPWEEDPVDGSTHGRNSLFELNVATKLNIPTVEIIGFDDVDFKYDGTEFNVQCKRLYSPQKIPTNIEKAAEQFRNKANRKKGLKGIIALSIDKIVGLEESTITINSYEEVSHHLGKIIQGFMREYGTCWSSIIDIDVIGVLIFIHAIAEIQKPSPLLTACQEVAFICIPDEKTMQYADYHRIISLATELNN